MKKLNGLSYRWGITFCFIAATLIGLEFALTNEKIDALNLENQLSTLKSKIKTAKMHQEYLLRQINSQSDPAWIEMVLKKELGLSPEGQIKIYFSADK